MDSIRLVVGRSHYLSYKTNKKILRFLRQIPCPSSRSNAFDFSPVAVLAYSPLVNLISDASDLTPSLLSCQSLTLPLLLLCHRLLICLWCLWTPDSLLSLPTLYPLSLLLTFDSLFVLLLLCHRLLSLGHHLCSIVATFTLNANAGSWQFNCISTASKLPHFPASRPLTSLCWGRLAAWCFDCIKI